MSASSNAAANASYSMLINCVLSATGALHVYDRVLNIGNEVDFIWRCKNTKRIVPALYLTMHTSASLFLLLVILPDSPNCQSMVITSSVMMAVICLLQIVYALIGGLRVYTVNGRSWRLPCLVTMLGLVPAATNLYDAALWKLANVPGLGGCVLVGGWSASTGHVVNMFTIASIVASDAFVFIAIWRCTGSISEVQRLRRHNYRARQPMSELLLRDGALQFGTILLLNLSIGVFQYEHNGFLGTNFTILMNVITNSLFSRMLFHLRGTSFARESTSSSYSTSSLDFKDISEHLGSESSPQEPCDIDEENEMDDDVQVDASDVGTTENESGGIA